MLVSTMPLTLGIQPFQQVMHVAFEQEDQLNCASAIDTLWPIPCTVFTNNSFARHLVDLQGSSPS
jgi:hypothetical protein